MLMMRLLRIGRKNEPHFRVVITDRRNAPKSGKFIEIVGSYNPKLGNVQLSADRIAHWIASGVQMSDTVYNFLVEQNLVTGRKKNKLPKKVAPVKEVAPEPVVAPVVEETPAVEVPVETVDEPVVEAVAETIEEPVVETETTESE